MNYRYSLERRSGVRQMPETELRVRMRLARKAMAVVPAGLKPMGPEELRA